MNVRKDVCLAVNVASVWKLNKREHYKVIQKNINMVISRLKIKTEKVIALINIW